MYVSDFYLRNYRSHEEVQLSLKPGVVCIYGDNGIGKTNLLDALYHACAARSAFFTEDKWLFRKGSQGYALRAEVCIEEPNERQVKQLLIESSVQRPRSMQVGGLKVSRRMDYAKEVPALMIAPQDARLITEGSQVRREYMDGLLAYEDAAYRKQLHAYRRCLTARNAVLKAPLKGQIVDSLLLDSYDEQMIPLAQAIASRRLAFLESYQTDFLSTYQSFATETEQPALGYVSMALDADFEEQYHHSRAHDLRLMSSQVGVHRDDYLFEINGQSLRNCCSQGQQKTFIWALRLTHAARLEQLTGRLPLLFLDDIFDKLDDMRIKRLFDFLLDTKPKVKQLFFTATSLPSVNSLPQSYQSSFQAIELPLASPHA